MQFVAHLDELPRMLAFVWEEGRKEGVSDSLLKKMELACEEALVNIISYAQARTIELECHHEQRLRFEVVIRDQGRAFNPIESEIDPQFGVVPTERTIGGLGIYLIRTLIDESSYVRVGDENILRLVLSLS